MPEADRKAVPPAIEESDALLAGAGGIELAASWFRPRAGAPARPVVLLIHGGGQTRHAWKGAGRELAGAGYAVCAYDQRGHGQSARAPDRSYANADFADDLVSVAGALTKAGPAPIAVGASLGGIASLLALDTRPDMFSALVLVDVAPNLEADGVARIIGFMGARLDQGFATLDEAAEAVAAYLPHRRRPQDLSGLAKNLRQRADGRYVWHWDPAFLNGPRPVTSDRVETEQRMARAARSLAVPTLLVRGQLSELVSEESVRAFRDLAPHAETVDVSGAAHMIAGDRNDAFAAAVRRFLDALPAMQPQTPA